MRLDLPQEIDKKQWLARLGVRGEAPEDLMAQLQLAQEKLLKAALPQGVYRVLEKPGMAGQAGERTDAYYSGVASSMELPGNAVKRHLAECKEIVLMAVTLGAGIERLIRTSQIRDMAEAVLLDSGASILAEQVADGLEEQILAELNDAAEGEAGSSIYMTPRYSPGYGDFPIEMQGRFTKILDTHRQIGLSVNENHILIPRKSITAIAGLADHPVKGYLATCDECLIRDKCALRKEGKNCAGL